MIVATGAAAPDTVPERPAGARRALALMAVALVLSMTPWFSATAVIPQLRVAWDPSDATVAWLTIAVQLGFVAGALVSALGNLSDLFSSRWVIVVGCAGASVVNLLVASASGPAQAIPLRFATGFFLACVYPPALKLMSTWFRERRGRALGILVGALTLGSAAPHLVNGLGGLDWRLVVRTTSLLTAAGAVVVAVAVREGPFPFPKAVFDPRKSGQIFTNRGVRLSSIGYFGHMWELYAMWSWFLIFFSDSQRSRGAFDGSTASYATFAVIGAGALGCWVGGVAGDAWGRTRTTASMMALSGTCAVASGFAFGAAPALVLSIGLVWGFSVVGDSAQFSTAVTEVADQAYVGTALTLQLAIGFTLTVVTIWLLPYVERSAGWLWAWLLLAPGPALGLLAMLRLKAAPEARALAGGRG